LKFFPNFCPGLGPQGSARRASRRLFQGLSANWLRAFHQRGGNRGASGGLGGPWSMFGTKWAGSAWPKGFLGLRRFPESTRVVIYAWGSDIWVGSKWVLKVTARPTQTKWQMPHGPTFLVGRVGGGGGDIVFCGSGGPTHTMVSMLLVGNAKFGAPGRGRKASFRGRKCQKGVCGVPPGEICSWRALIGGRGEGAFFLVGKPGRGTGTNGARVCDCPTLEVEILALADPEKGTMGRSDLSPARIFSASVIVSWPYLCGQRPLLRGTTG